MRLVRSAVSLALVVLAGSAAAQQPPAPPSPPAKEEHVRGTVASVQGDVVTITGADGRPQTLRLAERTRLSVATKGDLSAIQKDSYVGVTAVEEPGGVLRALEVHVFPETARGAGEGHRPWDLKPGSSMTNAMVSGVEGAKAKGSSGSSMTNATVSDVAKAAGGKKLELTYKDGKKTVIVPPDVPVVTLQPGDRAAIQAGRHLFAAGAPQGDGSLAVDRMVVGKEGVVPPM
jgi:hypothetical protein